MGDAVTIAAVCSLHGLGMRLPVAHGASRDLCVTPMAVSARHSRMLGHLLLQQVVYVFMAPCANRRVCGLVVGYLCRLVYRMTRHAVLCGQLHRRAVGFMARAALRDKPVFVSMAVSTGHIACMLAREVLYFTTLFGVAKGTICLDIGHWNGQRLVGINMASQTRDQCFLISVERPAAGALVAPGAVRHDLVIVLLAGIVDMILSVAAYAVNLVPDPLFFDGLKN